MTNSSSGSTPNLSIQQRNEQLMSALGTFATNFNYQLFLENQIMAAINYGDEIPNDFYDSFYPMRDFMFQINKHLLNVENN